MLRFGRKRRKYRPSDWAAIICLVAGSIACGSVHIFRNYEAFIFLCVLIFPTITVLVTWYAGDNPYWPEPLVDETEDGRSRMKYSSMVFPIVGFTILVTGLSLLANQYFDHSEAENRSFEITKKYTTTKKRTTRYHVMIDNPDASPLAFLDLSGSKRLPINRSDYERLQPGVSRITMKVHPGFLHFLWYEKQYSVQ
ncbi:MAG: hypothetical protein WAO98_07675 [Alphaproteobacteria bacterium]